ncbi:serine/threonine protein phosphatase [Streptomyces sp. 6N223]|uniref:serine/threonine protein phosphatase n=1 Tax=Streptomyces sp. 6N223 TaxID=3457412 RepID=UPI003FCFFD5B
MTQPTTPQPSTPQPGGHQTWSGAAPRLQAMTVWTERRPGHGEDAEPLAAYHLPTRDGLLAVFDGSGGSGAAPAWRGHSNAWAGARAARLAAECWFQSLVTGAAPQPKDTPKDAPEELRGWLRRVLAAVPRDSRVRRSKLTGTMRRALPTTMAAIHYHLAEDSVRTRALWAGDSRAYVLLPGTGGGLRRLTRDDTVEDDALAQLRQDPPMTNVICAGRDFTVNAHQPDRPFPLPCVLLAATDGFFGYVHTPAHFERLLLQTLWSAGSMAEWAKHLRERVQPITADDASLSLVALGFDDDDFGALHAAFAERRDQLTDPYWDAPLGRGEDALRRWQDETWNAYRTSYELLMPPEVAE